MKQSIKGLPVSTIFIILCFALPRGPASGGDDWPPITPEETALTDDPLNPGAPAMILYRGVFVDDENRCESYFYRYKIFKEEGREYADVEIPYNQKTVKIEEIRARTLQPDGKEVPFTGQIFDKLIAKSKRLKYQAKTFALPDPRPGSMIEYSYKAKLRGEFPDELTKPWQYIFADAYTYPTASWTIEQDLSTRRARFSVRPLGGARLDWLSFRLPPGKGPTPQPDRTYVLELSDIPAFQEEDYIPPEAVLKGRVYVYYRAGPFNSLDWFWRHYAEKGAAEVDKYLNKKKAITKELERIVGPRDSPEAKLRKLYARAQQIRALSFERERTEKEEKKEGLKENKNVEDILKHGYARANEINLLFVALARAAGYEASIVQLTTRNSDFFKYQLPVPHQLNALVAWVRYGDQDRYFDPATLYCPFDLLPWEETDAHGVGITSPGRFGVTTPQPKSEDAVVKRTASLEMDPTGAIRGKAEVVFVGQEALERRLENTDTDATGRRKALEDEVKGWLPSSATVELENEPAWEQSDMNLKAECQVTIPDFGASTGKRLIFAPGIFQATGKHPFPNAKRVHPIYFKYPYQVYDDITLKVPEGYEVESLPAPRKMEFPFCQYEISRTKQGNTVRLKRRLVMDGYFIKVEGYPTLRIFYDSVRAGDEEQIVLKAVETAQIR